MDWGKKLRKRRLGAVVLTLITALLPALLASLLGGCSTATSNSLPDTHERALTPLAFLDFCVRFPDQCAMAPGARAQVTLDDQTLQQLASVNHAVNAAITPEDDKTHYGRDEFWTIPTDGRGDCEDYALTKRQELLAAGLPASALRLAVVYSVKTALHAVLTVATDQGDLVLDNVSDAIVQWNATDFTWIMVQDKTNPLLWDSLRPASAHRGNTAGSGRVSLTNLLTDPEGK
jgi:predicted transglutaminase-like cysteine proteinase